MNIAILGGSFNPPHIGHSLVATQIKELYPIDEVWFMPTYIHPFNKQVISTNHRLEMTRYLENDYTKVSSVEIEQGKVSYTIDTLKFLYKKHPVDTFFWIIGSDQIKDFKKWKDWEELISQYNLIVFPRPMMKKKISSYIKKVFDLQTIPQNIHIVENNKLVLIDISSTKIRDRIKSKLSITHMVSPEVEQYIQRNKLYEQ